MRLLPWTATLFFVAPVAGALVERVGERVLIATGLLLQAAGLAWIAAIAARAAGLALPGRRPAGRTRPAAEPATAAAGSIDPARAWRP